MAGHLDAKEEWMKLRQRVNLAYYIGAPAVAVIHKKVTGEVEPEPAPDTLGIDTDGDGQVDATYTKNPKKVKKI